MKTILLIIFTFLSQYSLSYAYECSISYTYKNNYNYSTSCNLRAALLSKAKTSKQTAWLTSDLEDIRIDSEIRRVSFPFSKAMAEQLKTWDEKDLVAAIDYYKTFDIGSCENNKLNSISLEVTSVAINCQPLQRKVIDELKDKDFTLIIDNTTGHKIYLSKCYFERNNSNKNDKKSKWVSHGWFSIDPYSANNKISFPTDNYNVYVHAQSKNTYEWNFSVKGPKDVFLFIDKTDKFELYDDSQFNPEQHARVKFHGISFKDAYFKEKKIVLTSDDYSYISRNIVIVNRYKHKINIWFSEKYKSGEFEKPYLYRPSITLGPGEIKTYKVSVYFDYIYYHAEFDDSDISTYPSHTQNPTIQKIHFHKVDSNGNFSDAHKDSFIKFSLNSDVFTKTTLDIKHEVKF